ncbi:MAG: WG repeat-containing protein [Clostridia bacterium]|nr:WG repeat-containing protein [Clostridia bacterium]
MKKSKLKATALQITALLLFFAMALGVTAASAGLFDSGNSAEDGGDSPFDQLFRPENQAPSSDGDRDPDSTGSDTTPEDPEDPTVSAGYVQNLSNAFNTGLIQGYLDDRTGASLTQRVTMHNLLTSAIATVDGNISPVIYQSYSANGYTLVRRLQLDYEYTSGTETIIKYSKQFSNKDASYKTIATPYLVGRKTVQSYMGYLIVSRLELRQIAVTTPPVTTDPPDIPVTESPVTVPPETNTPVTDVPITDVPVTDVPATEPTTVPDTSDIPITVPTTEPVTDLPTTNKPVTEPITAPATTGAPVTAGVASDEDPLTPEVSDTEVEPGSKISSPSAAPTAEEEAGASAPKDEVIYETVEVTVLSIYDRNGNLLIDDIGTKEPYYARDYSNRPVFKDADGKLYAFDGKKFIETDKGKLRSELFYDYPAYPLGEYRDVYEAHYDAATDSYYYINYKNGGSVVDAEYIIAFNFGPEGYAIVGSPTENILMVINRRKSQVFKPGKQYTFYTDPTTGKKQYVKDFYYLPNTFGIESIGCTGFDNGYLRLRIKALSMMSDSRGAVVLDQYYLVNTSGERFDIPEGYTLEGYSDGVLLLSKDGLYGYYSIEGDWIAQPIYTYARPFVQGLAVLGSEDGTVGMIDTKGNIVLPFVFTSIEDVSSGLVVTYCEGVGYETYELTKK